MDYQIPKYGAEVLFNENPLPLMLIELNTNKILKTNSAATAKFGYSSEELLEMDLSDFRLSEDKEIVSPPQVSVQSGHYFETISRCVTKKKRTINTSIQSKIILYKEKEVAFTVINDVSPYKSIETRIINAQSEAIDMEREAISQEIHDGLVQILAASQIYLKKIHTSLSIEGELMDQYNKALNLLGRGISEARSISHNLMPKSVVDLTLNYLMQELVDDFSETSDIKVNFTIDFDDPNLSDKVKINVYRIMQEALNNIRKHSKATQLDISLIAKNKKMVLDIVDNGVGFDHTSLQSNNRGIGLKNLKRRTALIEGILNIFSQKGKGTRIKLRVPLKKDM
ncbi:MAG: PAS domain-containing sensor histidine kinase [Cyclobacteriaceae bacterium]